MVSRFHRFSSRFCGFPSSVPFITHGRSLEAARDAAARSRLQGDVAVGLRAAGRPFREEAREPAWGGWGPRD